MRSIRSVLHSLKPQKRVLIIGSAFVDMVINVQEMPRAGADVEGDYRCTTVGGCSFNVADVLYKLDLPFESYMPVGEGRFADLVAQALTERGGRRRQRLVPVACRRLRRAHLHLDVRP